MQDKFREACVSAYKRRWEITVLIACMPELCLPAPCLDWIIA